MRPSELRRREKNAKRKEAHFLQGRFYDDTVARNDLQGRQCSSKMIGKRQIELAYAGSGERSKEERARIELFNPALHALAASTGSTI